MIIASSQLYVCMWRPLYTHIWAVHGMPMVNWYIFDAFFTYFDFFAPHRNIKGGWRYIVILAQKKIYLQAELNDHDMHILLLSV